MHRRKAISGASAVVVLLALAACSPWPAATSSDSGDFIVITTGAPSAIGGQALADGVLALAGSCIALEVGGVPTLAVFPPETTVADDGSVAFADGTEWALGAPIRAGGGSISFEDLASDVANVVPEDCATAEVFFIVHVD